MNKFLRFLSYIITRLTAIALIVLLIILAVFIGFDWANINVIVNEGLSQRAQVAFTNSDSSELKKFYTQDFLNHDPLLSRDPYEDFIISNFNHHVKVKKLWVWPWQNETKVIIEEVVTQIEGAHKDEESSKSPIPSWENGKKLVVMKKDGKWKINDVILMETIEVKDKKEDTPEDKPEDTPEDNPEDKPEE